MINVNMHLEHPEELEAFSKFAADMAGVRRTITARQETERREFAQGGLLGFGAINREESANWRNAALHDADSPLNTDSRDIAEIVMGKQAASGEGKGATARKLQELEAEIAAHDLRPIGSPSGSRSRRTKAEIAEDEKLLELLQQAGLSDDFLDTHIHDEGRERTTDALLRQIERKTDAAGAAQISTGENRTSPEDDPEIDAQDAADEAAERAANHKGGLTLDDVRAAVGRYQKKHGMAAASKNIRGIIGKEIVALEDSELEAAIASVDAAAAGEVASETTGSAFEDEAPAMTKNDVMEAMLDYAEKFDGTRDPNKAVLAGGDCIKIFTELFGVEHGTLSKLPTDSEAYGKAVVGIREAIAKNPFKRGAK